MATYSLPNLLYGSVYWGRSRKMRIVQRENNKSVLAFLSNTFGHLNLRMLVSDGETTEMLRLQRRRMRREGARRYGVTREPRGSPWMTRTMLPGVFMLKTIMGMLLSRHRETAAVSITRRFRRSMSA